MAILIAKISNQVFHDEISGYYIFHGKVGSKRVSVGFYNDAPKPLKTVEYKLVGEWRKQRDGRMIFDASKFEKVGVVGFTRPLPKIPL